MTTRSSPYVTNIPGSDKIMVIWNNAKYDMHWRSHYGKRSPLTAAISADGGVTFTNFWDIGLRDMVPGRVQRDAPP